MMIDVYFFFQTLAYEFEDVKKIIYTTNATSNLLLYMNLFC